MRKTHRSSSFLVCLLINILLNIEWAIPGVVLLVLHFVLDISIWYSIGAFALWILIILLWMLVMNWAAKCSNEPKPEKPNKNPYSVHK